MENLDIQTLWKQNELLLQRSRNLNVVWLKKVKLDKAKSSLKGLLFLPISTLIFFILLASYALYFSFLNFESWHLNFSGAIVAFFSVWLVISSMKQIKQILSINFSDPILKLQKDIASLKLLVIYNLKIAAWSLPFGPFIGVFLCKVLFNFDLMRLVDFKMLISFGISTLLLEVVSLFILKTLRPKNSNKKWMNWLLQGSGSQINIALQFLNEIEDFECE